VALRLAAEPVEGARGAAALALVAALAPVLPERE
jgi:hypothetical protein